ncbi:MAG: hypothetical protein HY999_02045 [Nitrospinae bacterium]|nr:hypothetical protein [Nitrospinota bacterium]
MFSELIAVKTFRINKRDYEVRYYQNTNLHGSVTYSLETQIGEDEDDKIIFDDKYFHVLEERTYDLLSASIYSRMVVDYVLDKEEKKEG